FAGNVFLAPLAECGWQIGGFYTQTRGQELAVAGDIRNELHTAAAPVLGHDKRGLSGVLELAKHCPGIEKPVDWRTNAQHFVGIFGFDQPQETTQTLTVTVDIWFHECPLLGPQTGSSYMGFVPTGRLRPQIEHCARTMGLNGSANCA